MKSKNSHISYYFFMGILFVLGCYLVYSNYNYKRQLDECNDIINELMLHKELTRDIVKTKSDSIGNKYTLTYLRNTETNAPISYNELDSMYQETRNLEFAYETILLRAKKLYQFDFSYKFRGDTLETSIWPKSRQTKTAYELSF